MRLPAQKPAEQGLWGNVRGLCWEGGEGRAGPPPGSPLGSPPGSTDGFGRAAPTVRIGVGSGEIHGHGAAGLELHPKGRLGSGFAKIFLLSPKPGEKSKPRGFWQGGAVLVLGARERSRSLPWCDQGGDQPCLGQVPPLGHILHFGSGA